MQLKRAYKIEKAVSKDSTRMAITDPFLDKKDGPNPVLVATDGHMMAIVPVQGTDADTGGIVPVDAIVTGRKMSKVLDWPVDLAQVKLAKITTGDSQDPDSAGQTFRRPDWTFPNWRQVVPDPKRKEATLSLDAAKLLELAKAIGIEKTGDSAFVITLRIAYDSVKGIDNRAPIRVDGMDGAFGVLMPCRAPVV